ncbi:MAG TPA: site-2 protease family protein [Accumulibacter sp.]|uniref:Site-2 protease family protein n=2 Tax=Candidatus Accumulibacter TaxID=327159 RepID=A0A080M802_9PROT|nr:MULTISPECIES: site-2 protease family protein [Candidatus Accumulibacter]KFB77061.1 MAG: Zn-dependent protease [Candidatus Accumulibacter cognatus]MBL8402006.1 site-2 protease family protein [Accumulibacter sp.]MBN8518671.1 site-2 protease family protein [Accumulibacter sp.]MBO3710305.1 site-2 protease family protein [Accumulibacter sp.]MCC2866407.1 site-2 protease family protein [Candidatus Accumulibacter phosphatis]
MQALIQTIAIAALPVILAITLHEAAHGYAARHFGDPTAWQAGRITANPLKHVDLVGTILVPAIILLLSTGGILFGWAKPVPVNFGRLHHPKSDMLWVAAAGPAANFAMLLFWAALFKLALLLPINFFSLPMARMAEVGISINIALMVLNLFPLPPLDGGRIAVSLLPPEAAWRFAQIERFGFPILLLLLFTGVLGSLLTPVMQLVGGLIDTLFQFSS